MKKVIFILFVMAVLGAGIYYLSNRYLGQIFVSPQDLNHRSWAVVLDGQSREMERTNKAAELLKTGKVANILLSGTRAFKTHYLSEYYYLDMVQNQVDSTQIFEIHHNAMDTRTEAKYIVHFFRTQKPEVDTVLLVTSEYHTGRSFRIFNSVSKGKPYFTAISAIEEKFDISHLWRWRESRKMAFLESAKIANSYIEEWLDRNPELDSNYQIKNHQKLPNKINSNL